MIFFFLENRTYRHLTTTFILPSASLILLGAFEILLTVLSLLPAGGGELGVLIDLLLLEEFKVGEILLVLSINLLFVVVRFSNGAGGAGLTFVVITIFEPGA